MIEGEVLPVEIGESNGRQCQEECPGQLLKLAKLRYVFELGSHVDEVLLKLEFDKWSANDSLTEEHVVDVIDEARDFFE